MNNASSFGPLASPALGAIWFYQRFVSPRKGFSCAHRVLHDGAGCSGYAKAAIKEHGLVSAVPLIRQRFKDCTSAYETIKKERGESVSSGTGRKGSMACDRCAGRCAEVFGYSDSALDTLYCCKGCFKLGAKADRMDGRMDCDCGPLDCDGCGS